MNLTLHDLLAITQTTTGLVGVIAILWGLAQMRQSGRRRDKEIDVLAETLRESTAQLGQALQSQSRALEEILRRTA